MPMKKPAKDGGRRGTATPSAAARADVSDASQMPIRGFSRSLPMALLRAREAVMRHFRVPLRAHGLT